jgi:hypothetical protein
MRHPQPEMGVNPVGYLVFRLRMPHLLWVAVVAPGCTEAEPTGECASGAYASVRVGACLVGPGDASVESVLFTIETVETGVPREACGFDQSIGWLQEEVVAARGQDAEGRAWTLLVSLPIEAGLQPGMQVSGGLTPANWTFNGENEGQIRVEGTGLQAWIVAGVSFDGAEQPELRLERGAKSCYAEEEQSDSCTYTGFNIQATAGEEIKALGFGDVADVGPFKVIHGGLLSIGDRGACNAGPETHALGAVRR